MRMYTLLRNNKQSGPHTMEELKAMGLKVYDLIWIEGRSAAWLYAEEIPELEPFTPKIKDIVEESFLEKRATAKIPSIWDQYGKSSNTEKSKSVSRPAETEKTVTVTIIQPKETIQEKEESLISSTPVYAESESLSVAYTTADEKSDTVHLPDEQIINEQYSSKEEVILQEPPPKKKNTEKSFPADNHSYEEPSIKYTRSLDDIKQEYVSKVLGTERKAAVKKPMPVMMLLGVGVLLLIGVGILIGISLGKNTQTPQTAAVVPVQKPAVEGKTAVKQALPPFDTKKEVEQQADEEIDPGNEDVLINERRTQKTNTPAYGNQPAVKKNAGSATIAGTKKQDDTVKPGHEITPVVKKQTEQRTVVKRENLRELIRLSSNDYKKAALFGGLKNITITAANNSSHLVDLAIVEVNYIQANGKIFKTETLYFKNIPPKSSVSLRAANSTRGVKIESKLTFLSSKSAESVSDVSYSVQ